MVIDIAKDIIKHFEGLSLKSYICAGGMDTIGYGHVITKDEKQQIGKQITEKQAEYLLEQDIYKAGNILRRYCNVSLSINQQAALISFIFNCGSGAFQSSTLRQKLNRGEYILAANELPKWVHVNGIKLNGLVKRREFERNVFLATTTVNTNNIVTITTNNATTNKSRDGYQDYAKLKNNIGLSTRVSNSFQITAILSRINNWYERVTI